jgi:hypothetical protein
MQILCDVVAANQNARSGSQINVSDWFSNNRRIVKMEQFCFQEILRYSLLEFFGSRCFYSC